jgi:hypothetical protein
MSSSQLKVTLNAVSPAVKGVTVVIHFSKYAGFPSFPLKSFATKGHQNPHQLANSAILGNCRSTVTIIMMGYNYDQSTFSS